MKSSEFSIFKNGNYYSRATSLHVPSVLEKLHFKKNDYLKKMDIWNNILENTFANEAVINLKPVKSGLEGKSGTQVDAK